MQVATVRVKIVLRNCAFGYVCNAKQNNILQKCTYFSSWFQINKKVSPCIAVMVALSKKQYFRGKVGDNFQQAPANLLISFLSKFCWLPTNCRTFDFSSLDGFPEFPCFHGENYVYGRHICLQHFSIQLVDRLQCFVMFFKSYERRFSDWMIVLCCK